jgi:GNAT superfamily N-acetyltransferase
MGLEGAGMSVKQESPVRIIDLTPELEPLYLLCLEDWPGADVAQAGDHKARWYARARREGLRVKLALDPEGRVGGMIQFLPIEHAPALGQGLDFILCIWVHGHAQGRGNFQGRGMGTALLEAAEAASRERGAAGMAAWGLLIPAFMRASWFRSHGYRTADRRGLSALLWKPFTEEACPPHWLPETGKRPEPAKGKVVVTACLNGWCPAQNLAFERTRRAAAPFGERVEIRRIDTAERETMMEWGECDALFVDGRRVWTGPPPTEARLAKLIRRRVERLPREP